MKRLLIAAALTVIPASATPMPGLDCKLVIQYDPAEPRRMALTVPDKRCNVASMREALSYLLWRLEN